MSQPFQARHASDPTHNRQRPTDAARAMRLVRSGRPDEALRELSAQLTDRFETGDDAAATVLAHLTSNDAGGLLSARLVSRNLADSSRASPLESLAQAHLALVEGRLSDASDALRACFARNTPADDGVTVDACLLGARIALLRDDYEAAIDMLASGAKKLVLPQSTERARLEAYSLMFGVEFSKQLGQAQKLIGLAERLGSIQTPSSSLPGATESVATSASEGPPPLTPLAAAWRTQMFGGPDKAAVPLFLWSAAHGLLEGGALAGNLGVLAPMGQQLAEFEPLLARAHAKLRLCAERDAMGFAGEILDALLASRSEQSFQRTLELARRYPASQDIELLFARYAAHVGHLPIEDIAERIVAQPNDLRWLELGIEVALEVGNAGYAQAWAQRAWEIFPGARTGGWLVRAAQAAQIDWVPLRRRCEQALGFLGSSLQAPFALGHAMKQPVQVIYADALIGTGEASRAKGLMLQVLAENPQAIEARLRLGQAEIQLNNMLAAEEHLTAFLEDARGLVHPLASQARLDRAHVRVLLDKPRMARDDLRVVSPGQRARFDEALARVCEVDGLIAITDMGVRAHVTIGDLRQMVQSVEPREVDLTLREHAKRPQNRENVEFLTLLAKNNYRMGKSHDAMSKELASRAILIALAEGREAIEAAQILLDVNRRNPSLFRMLWAAISSVMSWFSSTVVNTGAP